MVIVFLLLSSVVLFTTFVDNEYMILALISLSLSAIATALSLNYTLVTNNTRHYKRIEGLQLENWMS